MRDRSDELKNLIQMVYSLQEIHQILSVKAAKGMGQFFAVHLIQTCSIWLFPTYIF